MIPQPSEFNYGAHKQAHREGPCTAPVVKNPTILFHTLDAPGRHVRIKATVRCDEMPKARLYVGQLEISTDGGTTVAKRRSKVVNAKKDKDRNEFVSIDLGRVNHKWKVRYRVRQDTILCQGAWAPSTSPVPDDAREGWSDWLDPDDNETPPAVTGLTLDVDQRRSKIEWQLPDDAENTDVPDLRISHLWVELWRNSIGGQLVARDRYHHGEHKAFRNVKPANDTFFARVYTVSHTGKKSAPASTSATRNTPSTPAPPSVSFDKTNKRWSAEVTASTVADTDADIVRYVIQLVHKTNHSQPTAGDKRSHGVVDGDGTGDDLTEIFRGIPANHFVYVRERARDDNGRLSGWSTWTDAGKPAESEDEESSPGDIKKTRSASVPTGWLRCNGASYPTSLYPDLFAVIGYGEGGSGPNFNVPDMRGRHPIGAKSSGLDLGADEGDAEVNRSAGHGHATDQTDTSPDADFTLGFPDTDGTGATNPSDGTGENQGHTHNYGGDVTGGPSTFQANIAAGGAQRLATDTHTHTMAGFTDPRDVSHSHGHTHGSHPHPHGHGGHPHPHGHGFHRHQHGHDSKVRPHKAVHFLIKT
jgi:microcystin-dependent protein